jgi:hypothetical protein
MVTAPTSAYLDLVHQPQRELARLMLRGEAPKPADLVGLEFRGTNMPAGSRALGLRRFIKGFTTHSDGSVVGYNRRVRGGDLATPWTPSTWRGQDRFGWYAVEPVAATARDNRYLNAVLLDYGSGLNTRWDPTARLRDYLVRTDAGLILGRAYVALGPARIAVGYFALEQL